MTIEVITRINGKETRRTAKEGATISQAEEYAESITLQGPAEYSAVIVNGIIRSEHES